MKSTESQVLIKIFIMCLYPKLIKNRKYLPNKKNKGIIPSYTDDRVLYVPVGCGKCIECRKEKKREWQVRLNEEIRSDANAIMVTLTFSEEELEKLKKELKVGNSYEDNNEVASIATRRFLERWRAQNKKSVKHWLITELGQDHTERIHLHGLIWTDKRNEIEEKWKYGFVRLGTWVNEQTVNYLIKYVHKIDEKHKEYKSKIFTSKGIGKSYTNRPDFERNKYTPGRTKETYKTRTGVELALPIYYRNKRYSEEEREKLWIEKLDKQERWVCGEKVSVKENEREYEKLREYYREKNRQLGYGSDIKTWDETEYKIRSNAIRRKKIANKIKINTEHLHISNKDSIFAYDFNKHNDIESWID